MKYFADPIAVAIVFGATLLIIGATAEPAPVKLPDLAATRTEGKPEAPRPAVAATIDDSADGSCRAAAWPHLPSGCVAQASAERQIRVVR